VAVARASPTSIDFVGINSIEVAGEASRREIHEVALEIAVDIARMVLLFHKRPVDEDAINANLPKLADHRDQVVDEVAAPGVVPPAWRESRSCNQVGRTEICEGERIVRRREKAAGREEWQPACHDLAHLASTC
jgi:hypothetical protein